MKLTYEERNAIEVVRRVMRRKPEIAETLLEGLSKEAAVNVLFKIRDELATLLEINKAFSEVAARLAKGENHE